MENFHRYINEILWHLMNYYVFSMHLMMLSYIKRKERERDERYVRGASTWMDY